MNTTIIPAVAFNRLSAAEQLKALTSRKPVDHKARTHAATVANIFAAKERHDKLVEEAMERTARENPQDAGQVLWI